MGMKLAGVMFLVMCAMGGIGYWYYNDTQARIATLQENNAKLEVAVQTAEASVETLQQDAIRLGALNNQLQNDLQKAEQYGDELRATLQRHNLTHLATKKPGLIEDRMQNATDQLWDDIRGITEPNGVQSGAGERTPSSNTD
mgnify:CR=1 FL=1